MQEYRQGIRGNYKVQKNPNKNQDIEQSRIYINYYDYYIGQVNQNNELCYVLSISKPDDIIAVKIVDNNFDFEFSLIGEKKKYRITNRTRFTDKGIISLGFDFEHYQFNEQIGRVKTEIKVDIENFKERIEEIKADEAKVQEIKQKIEEIKADEAKVQEIKERIEDEKQEIKEQSIEIRQTVETIQHKLVDNMIYIYGRDGDEPDIPIIDLIDNNVISFIKEFAVIPHFVDQTLCKLKNINLNDANKCILYSSCQNINIGNRSGAFIFGKNCGSEDGYIKISDNCSRIYMGDDCGVNGNIIIEKNCENIMIGNECGKQGYLIIQQNSGSNSGKIEFGDQCANQGTIIIEKNCANQQGSLLSFGIKENSKSFINQTFTIEQGVQNGIYVNQQIEK